VRCSPKALDSPSRRIALESPRAQQAPAEHPANLAIKAPLSAMFIETFIDRRHRNCRRQMASPGHRLLERDPVLQIEQASEVARDVAELRRQIYPVTRQLKRFAR